MLDVLKAGTDRLEGLIKNTKPEQYGNATPCSEYDVRALLNHAIGGQFFMAGVVTGQQGDGGDPGDMVGDNPAAAYRAAADKHLALWNAPGIFDKKMTFPGLGEIGAQSAMGIFIMEAFVHGWDLAKATGQDGTIPDGVANTLLGAFKANPISDDWRKDGGPFGPEILVADGASPSDKLVAYLGRQP